MSSWWMMRKSCGTTDPDLRLKLAREFGADDTLLKPFGLDDLTRKVSALLKG